jgi:hypothetical protein
VSAGSGVAQQAGRPKHARGEGRDFKLELGAGRCRPRAGGRRTLTADYARRSPITGSGDPGSIPGSSTILLLCEPRLSLEPSREAKGSS